MVKYKKIHLTSYKPLQLYIKAPTKFKKIKDSQCTELENVRLEHKNI